MSVKGKVIANLFGLSLFAVMLVNVVYDGRLLMLDAWISGHMHLLREPWFDPIVKMITDINGIFGAAIFSVLVVVLFAWLKWYRDIVFYLSVTLGATGVFVLVKQLVVRSRPESAIVEIGGYSFPSGHTTMATAMAFALYFILSGKTQNRTVKACLFLIALGWSLLIALTRLYLGVHWFSDVIGGFGLGLFWVTAVGMLFSPKPHFPAQ